MHSRHNVAGASRPVSIGNQIISHATIITVILLMASIGFLLQAFGVFTWIHELGHFIPALILGGKPRFLAYNLVEVDIRDPFFSSLIDWAGPFSVVVLFAWVMRIAARRRWWAVYGLLMGVAVAEYLFTFMWQDMEHLVRDWGGICYLIWAIGGGAVLWWGIKGIMEGRSEHSQPVKQKARR